MNAYSDKAIIIYFYPKQIYGILNDKILPIIVPDNVT